MSVHFNPTQNYNINAQKFGQQTNNANNAKQPKFGLVDGGVVTCPAVACACCAAPVAIPLLLLGLFYGYKGAKKLVTSLAGLVGGGFKRATEYVKGAVPNKPSATPSPAPAGQ